MPSLECFFKVVTTLIVLQMCFVSKGLAAPKEDKITSLPGQPSVKFNQYAGYIEVENIQNRSLFYYFVEAESNPETKPLVLWLNGGPGCSSLIGAFKERCPFMPKGEVLIKNNFSWNQEANMLFLESPAGVGFSYSSNKSFYNFTNDEITAQDNVEFLSGWLEKYPEYKNRDFFISGVSYAGHYVPQLADLVLESTLKSNLKGIAIGNPLLDFETDYNTRGDFLWSHGLISDSTYSMINSICNVSQIYREMIQGNISSACSQVYSQGIKEIGVFVDTGDVLIDMCFSESSPQGGELDVCLDIQTKEYLNRKDVQEDLHAKLVGVKEWIPCADTRDIGYNKQDLFVPTIPVLGKLVKGGVRVMVFCGDQDVITPFMGTRSLINALANDLGLNTTVPYTFWLQQNKQVGGWTQVYDDILTFATVRGGGHDPSFSQPERTLLLFNTFIEGKPLQSVAP